MSKKLLIYFTLIFLFILVIFSFGNYITGNYDKQNKIIVLLKKIIPSDYAKKIRDTLFYIPKMKERNNYLELIVKKHEQGLNGELFSSEEVKSDKNNSYKLEKFFLPFNKLDLTVQWTKVDNTQNRHYIEIIDDNLVCFSGRNKIIYFPISNSNNDKLNQKEISNNLNKILSDNNFEPMGIRDIFYDGNLIFVSLFFKDNKGYSMNIYKAKMNYEKLNFELFFKSNVYWDIFSVRTGGRIQNYKNNKLIYSFGDVNNEEFAQDNNNLKGKIISINKDNGSYQILSKGHRNQQGLFYDKELDLIINTEHGPAGGDEVNLNFNLDEKIEDFGWPTASYGTRYKGEDTYKKSHKDYGFIEPFKNYNPGLGISEVIFEKNYNNENKNYLFVSSLRAGSIYKIQVNEKLDKIIDEERIFFPGQRIRDIKYHKDSKTFFMLFETIPSIAVLKEVD